MTLFFLVIFFEGSRPTTRDAGGIDFQAVHVVAQVVPHETCRPFPATRVPNLARGHNPIRSAPAHPGPARAQELVREDTRVGCGNTS